MPIAIIENLQSSLDLKENKIEKGVANGYAPLGSDNRVPSVHLPEGLDEILEFPTFADFPPTGESNKIYVAEDTNLLYRWTGTAYANITNPIVVDAVLNLNSANPVQNAVIAAALNTKVESVNGNTGITITLDADDIDDTNTLHKFASESQLTKLDDIDGDQL